MTVLIDLTGFDFNHNKSRLLKKKISVAISKGIFYSHILSVITVLTIRGVNLLTCDDMYIDPRQNAIV